MGRKFSLFSRIRSAGARRSFAVRIAFLFALAACQLFGQIDRGTIEGVVKDQSGAVVPGARVQIIQTETNSALELSTNGQGIYNAPNLPVAIYRVVIGKTGFGTVVREPVDVRPRASVRVDVSLNPGTVSESITITAESPILDTAAINNSVGFKDTLIQELPMIVVGTKRDITGFLAGMPGANQTNTFIPTVNGSVTQATEGFIDGVRATERLQRGSLAENGPFLEQVSEVNVVTSAFNAEYGGFGNWFTNVIIKSGTNKYHGSVFDHLGNDKLNARLFTAQKRQPLRQNEGGFTLGGPLVIPGVYDGHDKTFFFGSLGLYFGRSGNAGLLATVPTQDMLKGDFSQFKNGSGSVIPIYDPASSVGGSARTQFVGNVIPSTRITNFARITSSYIPAPDLPGLTNNFYDHRALTWPYYNTTVPLIKVDHSISSKQKVMTSWTRQTRPRLLWGNPAPGFGPQPKWGETQTNPLDQIYDQQDTSWKVRIAHDAVITPTLLNHLVVGGDFEYNAAPLGTRGQGWDTKLGIKGIPQDNGSFPALTFTGGTAPLAAMSRGYDPVFNAMDYTVVENLTWIRGKHTMKFGGEIDRDQINNINLNQIAGAFQFSNAMTAVAAGNTGSSGSSVASFLLGAVNTASASIPVETGLRDLRLALFAQDEWRATRKLTVSYGIRWDYQPTISEVQGKMSTFQPNLANPGAGGRLGALAFANQPGLPGAFFSTNWKKGFGPRLGVAYQLNDKTVIRASSGIYYASPPMQNLTGPALTAGFSATPSFSSPDGFTPLYYLDTGSFPQNFSRPPSTDPSFLNGQAISYVPVNGTRMPQTVNYTFSIQRQLARDTSLEVVYLGSRTTHLGYTANYNYLDISNLQYGATLLQPITSAAAAAGGFNSPFSGFANQLGANTVYQSLRPYPQYTAVTTSPNESSGSQKFNSLQIKGNKRLSGGLTFSGFFTWSKSFSLNNTQYPGARYMQLDPNAAVAIGLNWAYELPFGKGKPILGGSSRVVNAVVSGWKINGAVKYSSGVPLTIGGAAGSLGTIGYSQWANSVSGVSPYLVTSPSDVSLNSTKYLNAAAFTTSTGFNFGNVNNNLSWVRGFWSKDENLTFGRLFRVTEQVRFDLSVDANNPFNFHRWNNPNTSLTGGQFGIVSGVVNARTMQVNAALRF
jgi:hypothetical protein